MQARVDLLKALCGMDLAATLRSRLLDLLKNSDNDVRKTAGALLAARGADHDADRLATWSTLGAVSVSGEYAVPDPYEHRAAADYAFSALWDSAETAVARKRN